MFQEQHNMNGRKICFTGRIRKLCQKKELMNKNPNTLVNKKADLEQQIAFLVKIVFHLQLENDILEKTSELLKKGRSIILDLLTGVC